MSAKAVVVLPGGKVLKKTPAVVKTYHYERLKLILNPIKLQLQLSNQMLDD